MRQKSLFLAGPSDPLGVPLHAIADSLPSHRFLVQQQGNSLVAHHDGCVTTVRVASPGPRPIDAPNIRSVVHVVTQLPEVIAGEALTPSHATASMLNSLASLGSVHVARKESAAARAAYARALEPKRLVMFTDGYPFGSWGDENYTDTVFILHGTTTIVPPWGQYAYYEESK
jgi:hypothetical protein